MKANLGRMHLHEDLDDVRYFGSRQGGIEIVANELFRRLARGQEVVWLAGDATPPPLPIATSRSVSLSVFNFVEKKIGLPFPIPTLGALKKIRRDIAMPTCSSCTIACT